MENTINKLLDSALNDAESALENKKGLNDVLVYGNYNHAVGTYYGAISVLEKISIDKFLERYENDRPRIDDMLKRADALYRKLTGK
jgi:hypothetical protein